MSLGDSGLDFTPESEIPESIGSLGGLRGVALKNSEYISSSVSYDIFDTDNKMAG